MFIIQTIILHLTKIYIKFQLRIIWSIVDNYGAVNIKSVRRENHMETYANLVTYNPILLITLLPSLVMYVLGIIALVYFIKALRIYIKKNM